MKAINEQWRKKDGPGLFYSNYTPVQPAIMELHSNKPETKAEVNLTCYL